MDAGHLLGPTGPLARGVSGYEHRPGQVRMARAVQDVLEHDGTLLIEAGTGTGKTWAYLIPAAMSGRRVLVSTGTRALQDQIMEKDLPALKHHLGIEIDAVCVKGLGNYLCRRRFDELSTSVDATQPRFARSLPTLRSWVETTDSGDRATLASIAEEDPIWSRVVSGSDTRIGARCGYYDECFATRVRRRAEGAQLVVVNHHLFFADLALRDTGFASVLPDYDAVIFDEAHQIEDTATLFFGSRVSVAMLERLVRDARAALRGESGGALAGERRADGQRHETRLLDAVLQQSSKSAVPTGSGTRPACSTRCCSSPPTSSAPYPPTPTAVASRCPPKRSRKTRYSHWTTSSRSSPRHAGTLGRPKRTSCNSRGGPTNSVTHSVRSMPRGK
ncbi:MAG: ATP-dependent DNA helicase [Deltaproteobacteria bacterium]|nr:ATP-dependent DNA helicase [Deltaproteobacteria bacterium]